MGTTERQYARIRLALETLGIEPDLGAVAAMVGLAAEAYAAHEGASEAMFMELARSAWERVRGEIDEGPMRHSAEEE